MTEPPDNLADPLARYSLAPQELKELMEAGESGTPLLAFRRPHGALALFRLQHESRATIGRGDEADLSLRWDEEVSALHAELECLGGEWTIVDDGLSRNGTYVNGTRMSGRHRLRDGDRVRLGRTVLAYVSATTSEAGGTVAAAEPHGQAPLTETQRRVLIALCRPYRDRTDFAIPASNREIAEQLFLSVDSVKLHLRTLFGRFGLSQLPQNQKRTKLAECALQSGAISQRELD